MLAKIKYLMAEIAVLYIIMLLSGWAFLYFTVGTETFLTPLLAIFWAFASIPGAIKMALIGSHGDHGLVHALTFGFYNPIRPIAMVAPTIEAWRETSGGIGGYHQAIRFAYASGSGLTPLDVIDRLSDSLTQQGIAHSRLGGITVRDQGAKWRIEADLNEDDTLSGWIESSDPRDREQVMTGLYDFITGELGLTLQ